MRKHLTLIFILGCLFHYSSLRAQDSTADLKNQPDSLKHSDTVDIIARMDSLLAGFKKGFRKSYFKASLGYLSNNVYLGRKDSTAIPYIIPGLSYYHRSGLYAAASFGWLASDGYSRIDMGTIEAGYIFSAGDYDGAIIASKYFYNSQSTNIRAEIKSSVTLENGYDFGFMRPTLNGTLNFGSKTDILATFGVEHTYYLFNDHLDLTPTVEGNAGTLNFYNNYYRKRRYTKTRKRLPPLSGVVTITGTVIDPSEFRMLDWEASIPIIYHLKHFTISFTPVYVIPLNPASIEILKVFSLGPVTDTIRQEKLENSFLFEAEVAYRF